MSSQDKDVIFGKQVCKSSGVLKGRRKRRRGEQGEAEPPCQFGPVEVWKPPLLPRLPPPGSSPCSPNSPPPFPKDNLQESGGGGKLKLPGKREALGGELGAKPRVRWERTCWEQSVGRIERNRGPDVTRHPKS